MPDKEMSDYEMNALKDNIEFVTKELNSLQAKYRGQTGVNYMPPLRLAPRKRKEAPDA